MGYILIAVGIAAIIWGIIIITRSHGPQTIHVVERVMVPAEDNETQTAPDTTVQSSETGAMTEESVFNEATPVVLDPSSKEKGDKFENFVVNILADNRFTLLDRTQDAVSSAGVVAESCKNPDLHIQQKRGNGEIDYYVECKYRSQWNTDAVTFEEWQLKRYRQFQHDSHRKVIIALGVGGTADALATLRLVPLDSIRDNTIRKIDTKFAVGPTSSALYDYMNAYFSTVFKKAKARKQEKE